MSVVASFDRAAAYDAHAIVQRDSAGALANHILTLDIPPHPRVLEIGCGTGFLAAALVDRLVGADWLLTDIAPSMLERCRQRFEGRTDVRFAVMDGEAPSQAGPFDLICSSFVMQWFCDLPSAIARLRRLLAPGGRLAFATLAEGSFAEWQAAHGPLDSGTMTFPSAASLADLQLEVTTKVRNVPYPDAKSFLRGLKAIGAGTPHGAHRPLPPARLREVMDRFEASGSNARYVVATCTGGRLP